MRDIGKNIKALREKKGMTQEALAEALFVTRQTVSNYETGRSRPDLDMLVKIADVLGADVNQVLYGLPAEQDRLRVARRLGIACLILLGISLLGKFLAPILKELWLKIYTGLFPASLFALLSPARWLVLGWCILQVAGLVRVVKPLEERPWVTRLRRGLLLLMGLEVVLLLPMLVVGIVQLGQFLSGRRELLEFPAIPVYSSLTDRLLVVNILYPQIYVIPGGALWLLRFPKP